MCSDLEEHATKDPDLGEEENLFCLSSGVREEVALVSVSATIEVDPMGKTGLTPPPTLRHYN